MKLRNNDLDGVEGLVGEDVFALRVADDGMINAGILPGDLILIKRQSLPHPDDIIVALLSNNETILRYLRKREEKYFLDVSIKRSPNFAL